MHKRIAQLSVSALAAVGALTGVVAGAAPANAATVCITYEDHTIYHGPAGDVQAPMPTAATTSGDCDGVAVPLPPV